MKKEPHDVPARVRAAQEFIDSCRRVTDPIVFPAPMALSYAQSAPGRTLSPREQSTYDAALSTLRLYFLGEMDYTDPPHADPPHAGTKDKKDKKDR